MLSQLPGWCVVRLRRSLNHRKDAHLKIMALIAIILVLSFTLWSTSSSQIRLIASEADEEWVSSPSKEPLKLYAIDNVVLDDSHTMSYKIGTTSELVSLNLPLRLEYLLRQRKFPKELLPLFEDDLVANIQDHDWINTHWFQLSVSKVWLQSDEVYYVAYRLLYVPLGKSVPERKDSEPLVSFFYVEIRSSDGEIISEYPYNGLKYPTILPIKVYDTSDELKKSYGPQNLSLLYQSTKEGTQQPLILFNALVKGSTMLFWIQPGREYQSWEPQMLTLKVSNAISYKNWVPFFDRSDSKYTHDSELSFLYHMSVDDIVKCNLDIGECRADSKGTFSVDTKSTLFADHTPLTSIKSLLTPSWSKLPKIKDVFLGFSNILLEKCGCGTKMYRPSMVVYVMDDHDTMHMVQLSQMMDFNLDIENWDLSDTSSSQCSSISFLKANSIETIDNQLKVMVTNGGDSGYEISVVGLFKEISTGLSFMNTKEFSAPDFERVIQSSQKYCSMVGKLEHDSASQIHDIYEDYNDSSEVLDNIFNAGDFENYKIILYPDYIKNPEDHYKANFGELNSAKEKILQLGVNQIQQPSFNDLLFKSQPVHLYNTFTNLEDNASKEKCSSTHQDFSIGYTEPIDMTGKFSDYLSKYIHKDPSLGKEQLEYFYEYGGFLESHMEEMMNDEESINHYWFRFGGASVYMKEYGIFLMLSRVIYTPTKQKSRPAFSMTFLQVFNKNWEEMKVELIVPNSDDPENRFNKFSYPGFARIASYHDSSIPDIKSYGPEDPRILLRRNHLGHEEPMIIFTQMQREVETASGKDIKMHEYRNMFYTLPWEVQLGKSLVDPLLFKTNRKVYSKTVELSIYDEQKGEFKPKRDKEKNWTPFFSPKDREASNGVDSSVYFVYLWEYLHVLKCEIPYGQVEISKCVTAYHNKPKDESVGSFRGGTQLISVNDLIADLPAPYNKLQQEFWIGLARSHIASCGCGLVMYRPQVAIVTKSDEGSQFQVSHVSSFMGFDMDIMPYYGKVCQGPNVFLPNGLSNWRAKSTNGNLDDMVTMFYTLSDKVQGRFEIRGLLSELLRTKAFEFPEQLKTGDGRDTDPYLVLSHLKCAEIESREFCKAYGEKHPN